MTAKAVTPKTTSPLDPNKVLAAPPTWVYKQDRRSRVWRIDSEHGPLVIKRFEYAPPRQLAAALLRVHPGQRELRRNEELRQKKVPVVPILASGKQTHPLGCRFWLTTPWMGQAVSQLKREGALDDAARRGDVLRRVADLTADLIEHGYANRDHKLSNLILDEKDVLRLIDVGAVKPAKGRAQTLRMLAMLFKTMTLDGFDSADRLGCLKIIRHRCKFLGPLHQLGQDIEKVRLP